MKKVLRILCLLSAIMLAGAGFASVDVQCDVEEDGSIRSVTRSVQFATGSELNSATNSVSYSSFSVYALLWFSQDQVAILEHDGVAVGIMGDFDVDDLETLFQIFGEREFTQVNGPERTYSIACKNFGRWVDPRLN